MGQAFPDDMIFQVDGQVIAQHMDDDSTILIHMGSERIFKLNATSSELWIFLGQQLPLKTIYDHLLAHYEVDAAVLRQNMDETLTQLLAEKMIAHDAGH
jgi:hypothetical protein